MAVTTVKARDFARDLAIPKKAAHAGAVIISSRRRPTDALLKIEDDDQLAGTPP